MSMAGAAGDRWAHRTHPSCMAAGAAEAAGAADAAGDVAAANPAVPPSSMATVASRATWQSSLMVTYLLSDPGLSQEETRQRSRSCVLTCVAVNETNRC